MKQKFKPILLILIAVVALVFLSGCKKDKYVTLELPEQVEANVKKLTKIKKGTEITLTITVPEGMEIDQLLLNAEAVLVNNNSYTFIIEENTVVEVTFVAVGEKVYFSLFLPPSGVTANVDNLFRIPKDTLVTLTVTAEGEVTLLVNGVVVLLTGGKYSFKITKDTNVELKAFTEVDKGEVTNLLKLVDNKVLREGSVVFSYEKNDLEVLQLIAGQVEFDENLNIKEMISNMSAIDKLMGGEWFFNETIYNDGQYEYRISDGSDEEAKFETLEMMPLSNFGIDIMGHNSSVPFAPARVGDSLAGLMAYIYKYAQTFAIYEHVKVYELDPYHKVVLKLNGNQFREVLRPIENHELLTDIVNLDEVEIEVLYSNLKIQSITFDGRQKGVFGVEISGSISYTDEKIVAPTRFNELDKDLFNVLTINLHSDNGKVDVVKLDMAKVHKMIYYSHGSFVDDLVLYKDGSQGFLFTDRFKTSLLDDDYFLLDNYEVDLYVNWVKADIFEDYYMRYEVDHNNMFALYVG